MLSRGRLGLSMLLFGAWVALAPSPALAYRPFNGTDADVAALGEFELELGPVGYLREGGDGVLVVPAGILNLGIYRDTELVLEGKQFYRLREASSGGPPGHLSFTDTALNIKNVWKKGFLQGQEGTSVASEVGMLLPTYHDESGVGASLAVIVSHALGPCAVHLNLEALLMRSHDPGGFVGLILEGPSWAHVRPVSELFVEGARGYGRAGSALVGAIWDAREGLSFDLAVRGARETLDERAESAVEVRLGLTWAVDLF